MFPIRISLLTYNLWNTQRWPEREPALRAFFQCYRPDIFCLQELRLETRAALDQALPDYSRVEDPAHPGWTSESNIFWNGTLFQKEAHGVEDIRINSDPHRGLFWARLKVRASGQTLLVSTAHYTYQEHPAEIQSGFSPRLEQAKATVTALQRLALPGEAVFFTGDLNDPVVPTYILADAGYISCFVRLGLLPPPTWPALPTANNVVWDRMSNQTIDWIVSNPHPRPILAQSPQFFAGDFAPSDHWPVLAIYEI